MASAEASLAAAMAALGRSTASMLQTDATENAETVQRELNHQALCSNAFLQFRMLAPLEFPYKSQAPRATFTVPFRYAPTLPWQIIAYIDSKSIQDVLNVTPVGDTIHTVAMPDAPADCTIHAMRRDISSPTWRWSSRGVVVYIRVTYPSGVAGVLHVVHMSIERTGVLTKPLATFLDVETVKVAEVADADILRTSEPRYTYYGSTTNSNAAGGGGGGGYSGGGGYADSYDASTGGSGNSSSLSAAAVQALTSASKTSAFDEGDKRYVTIAFNTSDRDRLQYPDSNNCVLSVPDSLADVKGFRVLNVEIPHTDYIITGGRVYISEEQDGVWQPFYVSVSSGNYSIDEFVDAMNYSFNAPSAIGSQNATLLNKYSIIRSPGWGKLALKCNEKVPFSVHFRTTNVAVVAAQTVQSATGTDVDKSLLQVTIADQQAYPLTPGAACTLVLGGNFSTHPVVVQSVSGSRLIVRSFGSMSSVVTTAVAGMTRNARVANRGNFSAIIGTLGVGASIPVSSSANLAPFSKPSDSADNLGSLMGFSSFKDISQPSVGTSSVLGLQSPFAQPDGSISVVTDQPHFAANGDIIHIAGSNTFYDSVWHQVVSVQDETHLTLSSRATDFMEYMSQTDAVTGDPLVVYLLVVHDTAPYYRIPEWLTSHTPTLVSYGDNDMVLSYDVSDGFTYDQNDFIGKKVVFDASDYDALAHPMNEWGYAEGIVSEFQMTSGSSYNNKMIVTVRYPTWILPGRGCTLTVVNDGSSTYSKTGTYSPCLTIAPSRFDMSAGHRYLYIQLLINDQPYGNVNISSIPGTTLFARIPLVGGADAITFLSKDAINAVTRLDTAIPKIRNLRFKLFESGGGFYDTKNIDWSISLQFETTATAK
ncbi:hypothetical protein JKP88DRAFT_240953 [Tribonema minus]|uniref:Uncharacterized protein n=1 Tax=Tribonema minus TaxID=303371 RepID=A0A835Z338_9STRA|nr:hypothetical protein JKP88DRAFT_240953 [Tribonema minus]